jgi:hypothetical protein
MYTCPTLWACTAQRDVKVSRRATLKQIRDVTYWVENVIPREKLVRVRSVVGVMVYIKPIVNETSQVVEVVFEQTDL